MNKLSLKLKLGFGFGVMIVILMITAIIAYRGVIDLDEAAEEVSLKTAQKELSLNVMEAVIKESAGARGFLVTGDESMLARSQDGIDEYKQSLEKLNPAVQGDEARKRLVEVENSYAAFHGLVDNELRLRRAGQAKAASDLSVTKEEPALNAIDKATDDFADAIQKQKQQIEKEEDTEVTSKKRTLAGLAIVGLLVGSFVGFVIVRSISGSTSRMLSMIEQIASNNLAMADMEIQSQDEIGRTCSAMNQMKNSLRSTIQSIAQTAQRVAGAGTELSSASQLISANSEETSAQAGTVSGAAQRVNENLQSVATGAEEMTATIHSIASNAQEAARVASNAVKTAEQTNQTVSKLGESSAEIGQVIKVITSIAQQTNLLALNAAIEAARAGEAGKGFAVVANEVKELAKQTAKATEDISQRITAIQTDTKEAVEAIGTITGVISQINDISGTIATAVEEQSATTNEMSRNVTEAAKGSGEITQNIHGVAEAANSTSTSAQNSQKSSEELAGLAAELNRLVEQFTVTDNASSASNAIRHSSMAMAAGAD